jgi:hypothetical protein
MADAGLGRKNTIALGLALFVAAASPARARPSVLVVPSAAGRDTAGAEEALRARGHAVRPWAEVRGPLRDVQRASARAAERVRVDVEPRLSAAMDAWLAQDFAAMQTELAAIETDALVALEREPGCAMLWELEFRRGLGHGTAKDSESAARRYAFAIALDPERRPSHELYGPDVAQAYLAAVDAQAARPLRTLELAPRPADASIAVDCRPVKGSSVRVRPGLHVVSAWAPGHERRAWIVDVSGEESPLELELSPSAEADPVARLGATWPGETLDAGSVSMRRALASVAEAEDADVTLTLSRDDDAWHGRAWVRSAGREPLTGAAEATGATQAEAATAAIAWIGDDLRIRPPAPRVDRSPTAVPVTARDEPRRKCRPVARCWWFWTILGTAAAGVAVGLGVGLTRNEPERLQIFAP